jgi:hypothetical protein
MSFPTSVVLDLLIDAWPGLLSEVLNHGSDSVLRSGT